MFSLLVVLFNTLFISGLVIGRSERTEVAESERRARNQFIELVANPLTALSSASSWNERTFDRYPLQNSISMTDADSPLLGLPRTGHHIVVEGKNISIGRYLWSGRTGEYYEVPGGWPGWDGDVVVKEFYIWYYPHELARELKYLSLVGQLVAHDEFEGVLWLIMHKPPGVHLTKTRAFKEAYNKGRRECDDLVERAYGPAFSAIIDLLRNYGISHEVSNARMLWDDNAGNPTVFDLGDDVERDPKDADDQDVRNEVALKVYLAWPNDGITYQDWCVNGQSQ